MSDIKIRLDGSAGRITLNRPKALNALTYEMCLALEAALDGWRDDDAVVLVIIDAVGDKAFCAGGDLSEMYRTASAGDFEYGRQFWRDEYRLNAKIAGYPKPFVAFMQGFTMGGGVGISCHGSHRIVGESSVISMPEVGVGLVPDVGGSFLLSRAPGRLGEYLGTTAARMGSGDAIYAGFADTFVPEAGWPSLIEQLCRDGSLDAIEAAAAPTPDAALASDRAQIDKAFGAASLQDVVAGLEAQTDPFAQRALKALDRASPLSACVAFELVRQAREVNSLADALALEYRVTSRSAERGDFVEGIRAIIVDKDRSPAWKHASIADVPTEEVAAMLAPLPKGELVLEAR